MKKSKPKGKTSAKKSATVKRAAKGKAKPVVKPAAKPSKKAAKKPAVTSPRKPKFARGTDDSGQVPGKIRFTNNGSRPSTVQVGLSTPAVSGPTISAPANSSADGQQPIDSAGFTSASATLSGGGSPVTWSASSTNAAFSAIVTLDAQGGLTIVAYPNSLYSPPPVLGTCGPG